MAVRLYHGSKNIIEMPEYGKGRATMITEKDFIVRKI